MVGELEVVVVTAMLPLGLATMDGWVEDSWTEVGGACETC